MLLTIEKVLLLKNVPMFALTPDNSLAGVARELGDMRVAAGTAIMTQHEMGSTMYVVAEGEVAIEINGSEVARLGPGEVVGELAALDPEPRTATVRAVTDCQLLYLDRELLFELMSERLDVAQGVVRFLIRRYRSSIADTTGAGSAPEPVPHAVREPQPRRPADHPHAS